MTSHSWFLWAALSAVFAALTGDHSPRSGLRGVRPNRPRHLGANGDHRVRLRRFRVACGQVGRSLRFEAENLAFLTLSALATGASWVCYFRALKLGNASQVAPGRASSAWCSSPSSRLPSWESALPCESGPASAWWLRAVSTWGSSAEPAPPICSAGLDPSIRCEKDVFLQQDEDAALVPHHDVELPIFVDISGVTWVPTRYRCR